MVRAVGVWEGWGMRPRLLAAAVALTALWLQAGPAVAQHCDNLEGQDVEVAGTTDRMVEAADPCL